MLFVGAASAATGCPSRRPRSRLKPLLQVRLIRHANLKQQQKLSPYGELLFFACAKKSNQKKAHPATRPPRCALRVRSHDGDSRKGHPAPAANGAHPCAPPFGFFPAVAAAPRGPGRSTAKQQQRRPQRQQQQQRRRRRRRRRQQRCTRTLPFAAANGHHAHPATRSRTPTPRAPDQSVPGSYAQHRSKPGHNAHRICTGSAPRR